MKKNIFCLTVLFLVHSMHIFCADEAGSHPELLIVPIVGVVVHSAMNLWLDKRLPYSQHQPETEYSQMQRASHRLLTSTVITTSLAALGKMGSHPECAAAVQLGGLLSIFAGGLEIAVSILEEIDLLIDMRRLSAMRESLENNQGDFFAIPGAANILFGIGAIKLSNSYLAR